MGKLRFVTAGESHGAGILAWLSGLPSGLPVDLERVNLELRRRQLGYGRGGRESVGEDVGGGVARVGAGGRYGGAAAVRVVNRVR